MSNTISCEKYIEKMFQNEGCRIFHYENLPIQIYWKFNHQKMKIIW